MKQIHNIFPTTVYENNISYHDELKQELDDSLKEVLNTKLKDVDPSSDQYLEIVSQFAENAIGELKLTKFSKMIDDNVRELSEVVGFKYRPYETVSWLRIHNKGKLSQIHSHNHADLVGVYYFNTNGDDGDIFFLTPVQHSTSSFFFKRSENFDKLHFKPAPGKLIMFPGWLRHGVEVNTTNNNRLIMAFNVYFHRYAEDGWNQEHGTTTAAVFKDAYDRLVTKADRHD